MGGRKPSPGTADTRRVSVVIPVLNESATIGAVVGFALKDPTVGEVLVIDDGSHDGTPERAARAGARVITSAMLGKGGSMRDGLVAARHDVILYLDGDLHGLTPGLVSAMTQPLLAGYADFVKARFARAAGRVTVLTARPLLQAYFPELAGINQPLGGIMAARKDLLETLAFENDYGVDVGLLIDAAAAGARIVQVDIGRLEHDSQSLDALGIMAAEVARTIIDRAARWGRLEIRFVRSVAEQQRRQRATNVNALLSTVASAAKLALFDMDGTLVNGRFVVELARRTRRSGRLAALLDAPDLDPVVRTRQIAALFRGVPKYTFEAVAQAMPLNTGAVEAVIGLRKRGYVVGVVTDSYHVAAAILRRRVFADFCIAHVMQFKEEIATGRVTLAPAMRRVNGCAEHGHCKLNVVRMFAEKAAIPPARVLAVGDSLNDACMLREAGLSVAYQPKASAVAAAARHVATDSLEEVLPLVDDHERTSAPAPRRRRQPRSRPRRSAANSSR